MTDTAVFNSNYNNALSTPFGSELISFGTGYGGIGTLTQALSGIQPSQPYTFSYSYAPEQASMSDYGISCTLSVKYAGKALDGVTLNGFDIAMAQLGGAVPFTKNDLPVDLSSSAESGDLVFAWNCDSPISSIVIVLDNVSLARTVSGGGSC